MPKTDEAGIALYTKAKILSAPEFNKEQGKLFITIEFDSDDGSLATKQNFPIDVPTMDWLSQEATRRINDLNNKGDLADQLQVGQNIPLLIPTQPTPEELARTAYITKLGRFLTLNDDRGMGQVQAAKTVRDNLLADLEKDFDPAFFGL